MLLTDPFDQHNYYYIQDTNGFSQFIHLMREQNYLITEKHLSNVYCTELDE